MLFAEDRSWLDCYHTPKDGFEESSCFRTVDSRTVPYRCVWKALPGWVMLTRRHVAELLRLRTVLGGDHIAAWERVFAPEEMYFPTMLCVLGFLREGPEGEDEVRRRRVTYAHWQKRGDARPQSFTCIDTNSVQQMRDSGAVFGRKFSRYEDGSRALHDWRAAIEACEEAQAPHTHRRAPETETEIETAKTSTSSREVIAGYAGGGHQLESTMKAIEERAGSAVDSEGGGVSCVGTGVDGLRDYEYGSGSGSSAAEVCGAEHGELEGAQSRKRPRGSVEGTAHDWNHRRTTGDLR